LARTDLGPSHWLLDESDVYSIARRRPAPPVKAIDAQQVPDVPLEDEDARADHWTRIVTQEPLRAASSGRRSIP
jgi:hypothetical protein